MGLHAQQSENQKLLPSRYTPVPAPFSARWAAAALQTPPAPQIMQGLYLKKATPRGKNQMRAKDHRLRSRIKVRKMGSGPKAVQ